jgi:hypothetical protein
MEFRTENYRFDNDGDISGWDEVRAFEVEVKNTREIPVKIEIRRDFDTSYWTLQKSGDYGEFDKVDAETVKFVLGLEPRSTKKFQYILRTYHGVRQEDWTRASR